MVDIKLDPNDVKKLKKIFGKDIDNKLKIVSNVFANNNKNRVRNNVVRLMEKGISPVKGKEWDDYSDSYNTKIDRDPSLKALGKKKKPVNLKVTGELHDSIDAENVKGKLVIETTDKLAIIHDSEGAGKKKVIRRIVPRGNEQWHDSILRPLKKDLKTLVKKILTSLKTSD